MRKTLLILSSLFFFNGFSQVSEPCGHVEYVNYLNEIAPGFKTAVDQSYYDAIRQSKLKSKFEVQDTVHTIRVVFHIVYNTPTQNLHDSLIHSQMEWLNMCFRRQNPDTNNTRDIFKPIAGDAGIQFELAKVDPNGDSTTGITRRQTSIDNFTQGSGNFLSNADRVKQSLYGTPAWDTDKYMNVWVCNLGPALYGFAFPPTGAAHWGGGSFVGPSRQGVVLNYAIVGEGNPNSGFTGVKTAVHEVGHFLGLRHIWGDAPNWDRCSENYDDGLDDTPLAGTPSSQTSCAWGKNTCFTGAGDLPDMLENYMDYSQGFCQNMFTSDQIKLMRYNLTTFRRGIFETYIPPVVYPVSEDTETGIYPNPAHSDISVVINGFNFESTYKLEIMNMLGQTVYSENIDPEFWQQINWKFALSGMHVYRIIENDEEPIAEGKVIFGME